MRPTTFPTQALIPSVLAHFSDFLSATTAERAKRFLNFAATTNNTTVLTTGHAAIYRFSITANLLHNV